MTKGRRSGFTLIELSIALVVIGLIVGGVLVGQDLIKAAAVRGQITQIEKYNTAANTFYGKYGGLPGDLNLALANQFGFTPGIGCDGTQGFRDGNGIIDGWNNSLAVGYLLAEPSAENGLFWTDLSTANLIQGTFPGGGATLYPNCTQSSVPILSLTPGAHYVGDYFPAGNIPSTFVYVYESKNVNWFGLSAVTGVTNTQGWLVSNPGLTVLQAYSIDQKIDDGNPTTGRVVATYINSSSSVVATAPHTTVSGGNSTSCYDTASGLYSITQNNGNGLNCALSFKFQ